MKTRMPFLNCRRPAALAGLLGLCLPVHAAITQAQRTDDFVGRIGVCIKPPSWQNGATIYGNTTLVASRLAELKLRHYRCDVKDVASDWTYFTDLKNNHGLKGNLLVTWMFPSLETRLLQNLPAVMRVEGPNETDGSATWTYNGAGFPGTAGTSAAFVWEREAQEQMVAWHLYEYPHLMQSQEGYAALAVAGTGTIGSQNALYDLINGNASLASIPVVAPSVVNPNNNSQLAGCSADNANMHSYPSGGRPTKDLDTFITAANNIFSPAKAIVATETGYHTAYTAGGGVTEKAHGKYVPRLFAEYFKRPIVARTYLYELFDMGVSTTNDQMNYGLLRNDNTIKPAFRALKKLIAELEDPVAFTPGTLNYSLWATVPGGIPEVSHILLQKSNQDFHILIWRDLSVFDGGPKTDITNTAKNLTVSFTETFQTATVCRFADDGSLSSAAVPIVNHEVKLDVIDTLVILKLHK